MFPQTETLLAQYPHLIFTAASYFQFGGLLSPVCGLQSVLMTVLPNTSPFSFLYGNPTPFGKDFSSYVRNNPVLLWSKFLLASFDGPQFCLRKRLQRADPSPALSRTPVRLNSAGIQFISHNFSPLANDCSVILCLKAVHTFSHPCCFWDFPIF